MRKALTLTLNNDLGQTVTIEIRLDTESKTIEVTTRGRTATLEPLKEFDDPLLALDVIKDYLNNLADNAGDVAEALSDRYSTEVN